MKLELYDNYFWQGEKVRLCALRIEDAEKKLREYTDTQARSRIQYGMDFPPVSLEAYIEGLKPYCDFKDTSNVTMFGIEALSGEVVGWINLHSKNMRHGTFGFGISIYQEYQKNGYGADEVKILLRYGFNQLRMQKCNSACLATNEASMLMHKRLNFREEGRRRREAYLNGQFHDDILWGMLKEEFDEYEKS
jgi:RimJ/RimL family protein N-acetyltransferase